MSKHLFFISLLLVGTTYGQCFDEKRLDFQVKDSVFYNRIVEYMSDAAKNNLAIDMQDKGIYQVINYTDAQGRRCMWLKLWIDTRYRDISLPNKYGYLNNNLLLFYEGKSDGTIIKQEFDMDFDKCLRLVVADRVYDRPIRQKRYMTTHTITGRIKVVESDLKVMVSGNDSFERIYVFEKDGSFSMHTPV